jgi:TetR/AcrR family transcriptional regulator, tetracycline repressor protein
MSRADGRAPLSRERIVTAALRLIDERGRDALTMRRLGAELGVEAMSLYKHVPGKDAILDGVRERLVDEFAASLPDDDLPLGWRDYLRRFARGYRALGLAHPEAVGLLAQGPERAYVAGRVLSESGLARLMAAGFDQPTAILATRTVVRYVLGFGLVDRAAEDAPEPVAGDELAALAEERPLAGALMRSLSPGAEDALFDFGLEVLLGGLGRLLGG